MTTLLVAPGDLDEEVVEVGGDAYRHLFRSRRLAAGERLRVADGRGGARWAEVVEVGRSRARLALGEAAPSNEAPMRVELLVAPLRPALAAWLVEKATEVGVAAVRFLACERGPRRYGPGTLARLRRVAAGALEQCGRAVLPEVSGVHRWAELGALLATAEERLMLDRGGAVMPAPAAASVALLVGPEGGWSDAERRELAALGGRRVGLGPRALRIETAAVAGAALLLLGRDGTATRIDTPPPGH